MKQREDIAHELVLVRALLAQARASNEDCNMLYGAQQALCWALGTGLAPSQLEATIVHVTAELDNPTLS